MDRRAVLRVMVLLCGLLHRSWEDGTLAEPLAGAILRLNEGSYATQDVDAHYPALPLLKRHVDAVSASFWHPLHSRAMGIPQRCAY
jgi:hypothetical protein